MAPTYTTDVPAWIPTVIASSIYDAMSQNPLALSRDAAFYGDLTGAPGSTLSIPTILTTTPATDLAENVAAVDDKLSSGSYTMTVTEGVKSIAWSDRTKVSAGQDVNRLAGQRVANAMNELVELNLGAKAVNGRNTGQDVAGTAATFGLAQIRALRKGIPVRLRRKGVTIYAEADVLEQLFADTTVTNAAAFGSDAAMRDGDYTRPIFGVRLVEVEPGTFPVITAGTTSIIALASGMLARAQQRAPQTETERDARGRLTRIVGTVHHAEGTLESAGIVAGIIG